MAEPTGFTGMHQIATHAVSVLAPERPPWVGFALGATGIAAMAADFAVSRHLARGTDPPDTQQQIIDLLRREAGLAGAKSDTQPQAKPKTYSNYLSSEGSTVSNPVDTDCMACASAHLGAMEGMLERAVSACESDGSCGPACQEWVNMAVQEPAALFARDWTPEIVSKRSPEEQAVVAKYDPVLRGLKQALLDGPALPQREDLVDAAALVSESTRFVRSGDGLEHPEVRWRLSEGEAKLLSAERSSYTAFPDDVYAKIRQARQSVVTNVKDGKDLIRAAKDLGEVAKQANAPIWQERFDRNTLATIKTRTNEVRGSFRSDLSTLNKPVHDALEAAVTGGVNQ